MKFGFYRMDESGHDYVIPEELIKEYDELVDWLDKNWDQKGYFDKINEFNNKFENCRVDGYLYDMKIVIEEEA